MRFKVQGSRFKVDQRSGQALLELAVFGSLMIMVLGALVNYGLNADTNQQASMSSFRQALSSSAKASDPGTPTSSSHILMRDRHFPDPSNPFGIGSMIPTSSSAGTMPRTNMMGRFFPETTEELPRMQFEMSGLGPDERIHCAALADGCTTSKLRVDDIPSELLGRYQEVYGSGAVCSEDWCGKPFGVGEICLAYGVNGAGGIAPCLQQGVRVALLDTCDGEILDYGSCLRQGRLFHDNALCARECERASGENCAATCSVAVPAHLIPWYARGCHATTQRGGAWVCPELDKLFANIPDHRLGLQTGMVKRVEIGNSLGHVEVGKDEEKEAQHPQTPPPQPAITTTSNVNWNERTTRNLVYHAGDGRPAVVPVDTSMTRETVTVWGTPWETPEKKVP